MNFDTLTAGFYSGGQVNPFASATFWIHDSAAFLLPGSHGVADALTATTFPMQLFYGVTLDATIVMGTNSNEKIDYQFQMLDPVTELPVSTFIDINFTQTQVTIKCTIAGTLVHTYGPFTLQSAQQWSGVSQDLEFAINELGQMSLTIGGITQITSVIAMVTQPYVQFTQFETFQNYLGQVVFTATNYPATSNLVSSSISTTAKLNNVVGNKYIVGQQGNIWYGDPVNGFAIGTGGTAAFNISGEVSVTDVGGDFYLVDGTNFLKIDGASGTTTVMTASAGVLPTNCRVVLHYRNRLMLTRDVNNPQMWYMSAIGDYGDYDYSSELSTGAVDGQNSDAGTVGDVVSAAISIHDDDVIMGGAQTLWKITGDPKAGGSIDALSYNEGVVGPNAWCRAPDGRIYFMSRTGIQLIGNWSQSGFRIMKPQNVTLSNLPETFNALDFENIFVRMEWDGFRHGFVSFQTPQDNLTSPALWYDERIDGWFPESYPTSYGPSCTSTVRGNQPTDRLVLLGCNDGYIRTYDDAATSDDGIAIASNVQFAPMQLAGPQARGRIIETQLVFGDTSFGTFGCNYMWFTGDSPQEAVQKPLPFYTAVAGQSGWITPDRARIRAQSVVFEIQNNMLDFTWSFESGQIRVDAAGNLRK